SGYIVIELFIDTMAAWETRIKLDPFWDICDKDMSFDTMRWGYKLFIPFFNFQIYEQLNDN
ncbi:MAG: hypothetical protein WC879_18530, partial [Melioribacteraceae bacterium]